MAIQLFVNIQASDVANGLVKSVTDLTPVGFPQLVIGDDRDYELFLVDGNGNYAPFSGSGAYSLFVAIGECGFPTGGTFTVTFGANTTAALAWNISPAALQTALQGLASIGANNVNVAGVAGQYYTLTFVNGKGGTTQSEVTVNTTALTPTSNADVSTIVAGGSGVNNVQLVNFATNPVSYSDSWPTIANGWAGTLSTRTLGMLQRFAAAGGSLTEVFQVTVADPDGKRRTYVKKNVVILCTIINPESFAAADKPMLVTSDQLAAAVLGANNFTREALTAGTTSNTNVSPATTSRHHLAVIDVTGSAGVRPISIRENNSPQAGDFVFIQLLPDATAGFIISIYSDTTAGLLLETITTDASGTPYSLIFSYDGGNWALFSSSSGFLASTANLAELASKRLSRANLKTLFSRITPQNANWTTVEADDGIVFQVTTATNALTNTLPSASDVGAGFLVAILKADAAIGSIVTSPVTETVATQNELMLLMSDGTAWVVLFRIARANPTAAVLNMPTIAGLSGGAGNLDGLVTADGRYPLGTVVLLSYGIAAQMWQLYSGTDASNPPAGVVRPTDYDPSSNAKVWKRIS